MLVPQSTAVSSSELFDPEKAGKSNSSRGSSDAPSKTHPAFLYNLVSVVIHHGTLSTNGHYSCFVYNLAQDQWTHRNDSRVRVVSEEFVKQQEAYLLIYERQPLAGENFVGGVEVESTGSTSEEDEGEGEDEEADVDMPGPSSESESGVQGGRLHFDL